MESMEKYGVDVREDRKAALAKLKAELAALEASDTKEAGMSKKDSLRERIEDLENALDQE